MELKQIKIIRSYVGLSRYMSDFSAYPIGTIPRTTIPSPYSFSSHEVVWSLKDKKVIVKEVSHKVYKVFEIIGPVQLGSVY